MDQMTIGGSRVKMMRRTKLSVSRNESKGAGAEQVSQQDLLAGIGLDSTEAQCLRQEITTRITLMNAVIGLELAVLSTGLTIIGKPTYVLAGLGAASSFLWLLWMDLSLSTYKIAAYLAVDLAPSLSRLVKRPILGWEAFLRRIEANGEMSSQALYPGTAGDGRRLVYCGRHTERYVPLLFGGAPPLLLVLYVIDSHDGLARMLSACLLAGLLWMYTVVRFWLLLRDINVLNKAITDAGDRIAMSYEK